MRFVCFLSVLCGSLSSFEYSRAEDPSRFQLVDRGGSWSIVDPAGEPMFLVGINHLRDNLPENQDEEAYLAAAVDRVQSWGMNHFGYGTPKSLHDSMPFLHEQIYTYGSQFRTSDRFKYVDVFDLDFQRGVREKVRLTCMESRDHPNLIGYYWTDTTRWDIDMARRLRGDDWVSAIRRLPADSAGKRAYTAFLRRRYGNDVSAYVKAYGHAIADYDDLRLFDFREFDRSNPAGRADDELFLGLIAQELYRVIGQAYRDFAPGVLQFGPRYKLHDHPDVVLQAVSKWVDVISIQPGPEVGPRPGPGTDELHFDAPEFDRIHDLTGKPILICDHRISFATEGTPVTLWHQMPDQASAVKATRTFLLSAASKPYIVGYSHCQYRDKRSPERGNMVKPGFVREDGRPYKEFIQGITDINVQMKRIHAKRTQSSE